MEAPTRSFNYSTSLTDVMVKGKFYKEYSKINVDPGYSEQFAQFLYLKVPKAITNFTFLRKRSCMENKIQEFIYLLNDEFWEEVVTLEDVNTSFNVFFKTFCYNFNTAFQYKALRLKNKKQSKWITKGLLVSRNKMWFLNGIKHVIPLSKASLNYVKKYQSNLQKVITEAIKRDNYRFIISADDKNKRICQLINEGTCTSQNKNNNITIKNSSKITSDPQQIADKFNAFFIDTI
jgi:hypothetical protein